MARFWRRPGRVQQPSTQTVAQPYKTYVLNQPQRGPALVTEDTMMALPAFYAAMRTNAGAIATSDVLDENGDKIDTSPMTGSHFLAKPTAHDEKTSYLDSIMMNVQIHGNGFVVPTRVSMATGGWAESEVIHPNYMVPMWNRAGTQRSFEQGAWLDGEPLGPNDFIHIKDLSVGGYAYGIARLKVLAHTIGLHASEIASVKETFDNGMQPHGYWTTPEKMDPQVAAKWAEQLAVQLAGRGDNTTVVGSGLKWESVTMSHADVQMLESRQWSTTEAAMIFGVPPHLIGAVTFDSDTYSNVRMDMAAYEALTLSRFRATISEAFQKHGIYFEFAGSELAEPTQIEKVQAAVAAVKAGICSPAQAAERLGWQPPDEDAKVETDEERLQAMIDAGQQSITESAAANV